MQVTVIHILDKQVICIHYVLVHLRLHDNYNGPGCQSVSNSHTQAGDAKQRKQERERARYAEQRNEINRKRREKYHIKK